ARFRNGSMTLQLARDRITVAAFHLQDRRGRPLDVRGSLGTHELSVGDVQIDADARRFEVVNDEAGSLEVDAQMHVRGRFGQPVRRGDVTVAGGQLKIDEIVSRLLSKPYSTEETPVAPTAPIDIDTAAMLSLWDRLAIDVTVHTPATLRMVGADVQVTDRTPL